jgi:hypothetical protein
MVCTFIGQGMIDRKADREEVRSSLELVRTELATNLKDIKEIAEYIKDERKSALYFLDNRAIIDKCPEDSINHHAWTLAADASITLSHDALELLKMSAIFQKMGNNQLSMDIIRAYDSCEYSVALYNKYISDRDEKFSQTINEKSVQQFASTGSIDMKKFIKNPYGLYTVRWISKQVAPDTELFVNDIDKAIKAIDEYLLPVRHYKNKKSR